MLFPRVPLNQLWTTIGFRAPIKRTTEGYKVKHPSPRYCIDAAPTHAAQSRRITDTMRPWLCGVRDYDSHDRDRFSFIASLDGLWLPDSNRVRAAHIQT